MRSGCENGEMNDHPVPSERRWRGSGQPGELSGGDLEWLESRSAEDHGRGVGWDLNGWADSTWILHAMYESADSEDRSHDDVRRDRIGRGMDEPLIVNGVNLDEVTRSSGVPLGMSTPPGEGWSRLPWKDLGARLGIEFARQLRPPSHGWFPFSSWPAWIQPPCEGSLDSGSATALVEALIRHSPDGPATRCHFLHVPTSWWGDQPSHVVARLDSMPLFGNSPEQVFTASNIWPVDRAWFVYNDYDLLATKISGTAALINAIRSDSQLETLEWTRRHG
jgi:hypothetical protein